MACIVLAIAIAACSDDEAKSARAARSWSATIALASDAYAKREISPTYARQIAAAAERAVGAEMKNAPPSTRGALAQALDAARRLDRSCAQR